MIIKCLLQTHTQYHGCCSVGVYLGLSYAYLRPALVCNWCDIPGPGLQYPIRPGMVKLCLVAHLHGQRKPGNREVKTKEKNSTRGYSTVSKVSLIAARLSMKFRW